MSSAEYSCKLFKPISAHRQTVWTLIRLLLEELSDQGPHCLQKWFLNSQADDKADNNCFDWQFKDSGANILDNFLQLSMKTYVSGTH